MLYNPGEIPPNQPHQIIKELNLENYHFQREQEYEYITTMLTSNGKASEITHSKWNYAKSHRINKVSGRSDQILIVSLIELENAD